MIFSRFRVFALMTITAIAAACTPLRNGPVVDQPQTTIKVDNQAYLDMTVYVMRESQRVRLGLAPGGSTSTFVIPPDVIRTTTALRFVADPVGGARASVSEEIDVTPGDQVGMQIPPA